MRLQRTALTSGLMPEQVLTSLDRRARAQGIPGPAALTGEWFGSRAVIAPSVRLDPVEGLAEALARPSELPPYVDRAGAPPEAVGGGWFGYLGYDLTDPLGRRGALPPAVWGWADHVLRLDMEGRWWFEALLPDGDNPGCHCPNDRRSNDRRPDDCHPSDDHPGGPGALAAEFERLLTEPPPSAGAWRATTLARPPADEHRHAVKACVHAIEAGELFQANVCTRYAGTFEGMPSALFTEGVRRLRPARGAYLAGPWGAAVSMSPELFLSRQAGEVRSTPIKGTRPRSRRPGDTGAQRLRASTKDVAENVMITDLVRNDLGRVCETGSVRVPELLAVRPAPGVWHLDSTVVGTLAPGADDTALLHATFPPGSVTGAPKIRALDLIADLEHRARGLYTGAMGLVSPVAGMALNVAIRTFEIADGTVEVGVGGGITADSDPQAEWRECLDKAAPLEHLLAAPPGA